MTPSFLEWSAVEKCWTPSPLPGEQHQHVKLCRQEIDQLHFTFDQHSDQAYPPCGNQMKNAVARITINIFHAS